MLPGIIRWQARSKSEVDSPMLGDLLLNVAHKVVHISEVILKIFVHLCNHEYDNIMEYVVDYRY